MGKIPIEMDGFLMASGLPPGTDVCCWNHPYVLRFTLPEEIRNVASYMWHRRNSSLWFFVYSNNNNNDNNDNNNNNIV